MKKYFLTTIKILLISFFLGSCSKSEIRDLYVVPVVIAAPISDAAPLCGSIKGTMLAGKTYTIGCDVIINEKDTVTVQEGVKINFTGAYGIGVKGTFICLGTKEKPNFITYPGVTKTDQLGADPNLDPALLGKWVGIIGGPTCPLMILKWTHVEFGGAAMAATSPIKPIYASPYPIFFQNPKGVFVLEDSWVYGSTDDPFRILGGKISVMRNTFEKCGYTGGEAMNAKSGTIGDFAYNLCIGMATNGPKVSNIAAAIGVPASNVRIYNNTMINCGYRRSSAGRGGSINFEQGAGGMAYNNLMVNCKFGLRVVSNPIADIDNLQYGYNFTYTDFQSVADNIYPSNGLSVAISKAPETDYPRPSTFLPVGWVPGQAYVAPAFLLGANNPQFVNGTIPMTASTPYPLVNNLAAVVGSYNFALKPSSPCVGKGYTGFVARADVPVSIKYGATEITPPGKDIGCYQINGNGNQH